MNGGHRSFPVSSRSVIVLVYISKVIRCRISLGNWQAGVYFSCCCFLFAGLDHQATASDLHRYLLGVPSYCRKGIGLYITFGLLGMMAFEVNMVKIEQLAFFYVCICLQRRGNKLMLGVFQMFGFGPCVAGFEGIIVVLQLANFCSRHPCFKFLRIFW